MGDTNGDGFPDYAVGAFYDPVAGVNAVRLYSGAPVGVSAVSVGCPSSSGVVPRIGCSYTPARGRAFLVNLSRVPSGAGAFLALGLSDTIWNGNLLPYDLTSFGVPGCFLLNSAEVTTFTVTSGPPSKGRASVPMVIPNNPALTGQSFHAQWLVLEPPNAGPLACTTRGLRVTIQ